MQQHQSRTLGGRPQQQPQRLPRCPVLRSAGISRSRPIVHAEPTEGNQPDSGKLFGLIPLRARGENLDARIESGEFTDAGSTKEKLTRPLRQALAKEPIVGRPVARFLADLGRRWRSEAAKRMPEARGDIREIVGQPVFVPLYKLFLVYGKIFRLSFGPKSFVIISDPAYAKQILLTNADKYSKGLLSEILDFVMGTGLIPADGEVWKARRRAVVPALHRKYVASMVGMFGDCTVHGTATLDCAVASGQSIDMENYFSRLALDIIGKAVFNYDFDSLTHDDPVIQAVYTVLREAEHRSTAPLAYWNLPGATIVVPRQRRCQEALRIVNDTLDGLIDKCKKLVEEEDMEFNEEFLSDQDPSILHFLLASGDEISSKQLRDDLMTMLIAGHETTAAVLTWTLYTLASHPEATEAIRREVDEVLGDRAPNVEDFKSLRFTTRVINEAMRLYPQPPVLIRRALQEDKFDQYVVPAGSDLFISVWNLHRSPELWDEPDKFKPERFGPLDGPIPNEVTENFGYLPFGGGRRKCIGDQFALFEALVALAMLVRRYDFVLDTSKPPVGMTTGATIHTTGGLYMHVKKRDMSGLAAAVRRQETPAYAFAYGTSTVAAMASPASSSPAAVAGGGCPFHTGAAVPPPPPAAVAAASVTVGGATATLGGGVSIGPSAPAGPAGL
ncbi:hypothetical protein VOLCADRAFT_100143 [Volvox carteri f. nagariensis]|uniref:Cytochrome P450 n=1 Tax=Volvox carteri f. nagariensis TaxID=3068 RepID=D8UJI7_VOLCA|nr:uncharacterized protein VOLCADRAFT_100143 [Volvox carteri f. nagariensis]EFJ40130.1 hypothetical protein VOLCADRAFT_100143 [Volvox carteri f. nagariensis]|eukprot:XP_002958826.1 hypothetical protein VOLCADRAFT_100143 [Volvox carteri f. nagariensis]